MELKFSLSKPVARNSLQISSKAKPSVSEVLGSSNVPFKDMWETYNHFRQRGIFCDVVLVVNGTKFPVHRAILAAHSSYFFALFTNGMKESMEDVITMEGLETDIMEIILNYIYTLKLPLNHENIYGVFSHAECFCLNGICDICVEYLILNLKPTNSIECLKFAKIYNRTDLISKCENFILQNFIDIVSQSNDFVTSIDEYELCCFLSNNLLNVSREEQVFRAAIHWINYNCSERASHMDKFLRCMRLGLLSSDFFLEEAFSNFHVTSNWSKIEDIADQAWSLINWSEKNGLMAASSRVSLAHPLLRPRIPRHVLFAIGGWSGDSAIAFIETYDSKVDHWYSHPLLEDTVPRAYHAMVVHESLIYLIGGFDGSYYFNSVKSFNPEIGEWKELAPMYSQRCYVSGASRQGYIYACGGFDGRSRLNTVECYSVTTNQWRYVQPMHHQRSDASADFLRDDLYIVGGFNGEHCLSSAECYTPLTDQWTLIHRMTMARSGVSLIAHENFIYALGGFDGSRRLDSCERFSPASNCWEPIGRMNSARSNFAVVAMDGTIYAIGGFDGSITISQAEAYHVTEGKWSHVTDLNMNRSALKACVLDGLPNSYRFTFYGHQTEHGDACREPPQVSIFGHNTVEEMFAVERGQASGSPDEDGGSRVMDCVGEVVIDMEYNAVRGDVSNGNDNNNNNNDDDDNDVGSSDDDDDDDDGGDGSDVFQQHGAGPGYGGFSMHGLNQFAILFDDQID